FPACSSSLASGYNNRWIPIKTGTDSALVLGMIQLIIEKQRYNKTFLDQPGAKEMKRAVTAHCCNATHLLIRDDQHP
ncbi:molybdopterin-dependent oxidoreductase, partial [Vibrio parahaemolyticus]|uniref:molybdopterin-dependent oxidoreductase n=1 Tax=Vibrio parahaemolyticus TaxID=670 RepID=UPI0021126C98